MASRFGRGSRDLLDDLPPASGGDLGGYGGYGGFGGGGGGGFGGGFYNRGNSASVLEAVERAGRRERKMFQPSPAYFMCVSCKKIEPKIRIRCLSCGDINSLRPCPKALIEAHEKYMSQPLRRKGSSWDDDSEGDDEPDDNERGEPDVEDDFEEDDEPPPPPPIKVMRMSKIRMLKINYISTGDEVLDHVFCGGAPEEHCIVLAAQPGTGKSTIFRRAAGGMSIDKTVMYASGEESEPKIKSEFARTVFKKFPHAKKNVLVVSANNPESIVAAARANGVDILIVDSLSTMVSKAVDGVAGKEKQMVHAAHIFMDAAHGINTSAGQKPMIVLLICHATKGGDMAGANAAKHIVDGAFFMEHIDPLTLQPVDDQNVATGYTRIRAHGKYRAGEITRVGYYKMTKRGLIQYRLKKATESSTRSKSKADDRKPAPDRVARKGEAGAYKKSVRVRLR